MKKQKIAVSMLVAGGLLSPLAYATNGMNLEGYGPEAAAMGGASMAYDNGTAAVMNNPATLGLMKEGGRVDLAVGGLFPAVTSKMTGMPSADSAATAFYMPAMGYANKSGSLTYGVGVFSQGGMGTEYDGTSFMSAGSGKTTRSEVGVGRFIIPLAYQMDNLTIGGSVDYVWAGMDLQMAMGGGQFLDMTPNGTQTYGAVGGSMMTTFNNSIMGGVMQAPSATTTPVNWGYFDFSNNSAFTGQAQGAGFAGKLGFTFKLNPQLSIGASYHTKTAMGDLNSDTASVSFNANLDNNLLNQTWNPGVAGTAAGTYSAVTIPVSGKISVKNFQWPETYGFGMAY